MESHPPRRQQAAERREQILDAACAVFGEKGYAGASMRDIARAVGVTEGLIYHYFSGKQELIHACWRERSFRAELRAVLDEHRNDAIDVVLTEMLKRLMMLLYEHGPEVRLHMAEMHRDAELAGFFVQKVEEDRHWLVEFLHSRQAVGEIRSEVDARMVATVLMGTAHAIFMVWGVIGQDPWRALVDREAPAIVRIVLEGIGAGTPKSVAGGNSSSRTATGGESP
jgi:AcrR family transcriptional regulator